MCVSLVMFVMRRCAQGAKNALEELPKIWPPDAPSASAAALGQIKICGDGVSLKVQLAHRHSLQQCILPFQSCMAIELRVCLHTESPGHLETITLMLVECAAAHPRCFPQSTGHGQGLGLTVNY